MTPALANALSMEAASDAGDGVFLGVDMRDPRNLPPGMLNGGENLRLGELIPETRKGVAKPPWANRVDPSAADVINHWGNSFGASVFRDPDSVEWQFTAADGLAWRSRPYNPPVSIPLPTGVQLLSACTFTQAFDKVFCFRGRALAPLVMDNFDDGFEDLLDHWNTTSTYPANTEIAYGPAVAVTSITRVGNTATVVTTDPHGFITGADVTVFGAGETEYNVRANVTVIDEVTFTYPVSGAPSSPASGTITCSNMAHYFKALGTLYTLTSLTHSTTTATATKNGHGFPNGAIVTIAGAVQAPYNGTFAILNVTANTFDYVMASDPGANATGTITARNAITIANHSPDSNPNDWRRIYDILPNADNALYVNNRLLVPTAFEPSSVDDYVTFNGGSYKKKDYIVATDYLDAIHIDFSNEFRINQGSADEIVDIFKFNENTVLVFKGSSWGVLTNVALDLSSLTLDMRSQAYGMAARGAGVMAGNDFLFVADKRGVVSVRQSENGKLISVDIPLSAPIQKLINRIDWTKASGIRVETWNSKLYVAVPLDNGVQYGPDLVALNNYPSFSGTGAASIAGFEPGETYRYVAGNTMQLQTRSPSAHGPGDTVVVLPGDFVATQDSYWLRGSLNTTPTASIRKVIQNVNNCLLVHDFVAAAKGGSNGLNTFGWTPQDTGSAIMVREFFKMKLDGEERLFFLSFDNYVNLVEELESGDQVPFSGSSTGLSLEQILTYGLSRAYVNSQTRHVKPTAVAVVLQTWNPNYSLNVIFGGVNKKTVLATEETRNPTRYFRPWDAPAWDETNVNDDHDTPDREDYSVAIPDDGLAIGSGIVLNLFQEVIETFRPAGRRGRSFQVELTNTQGRIKLSSISLDGVPDRKRKGKLS